MVTTVRPQPSHYDVLGLAPSATSQEISAAFARKMSLFRARPLSDVAQVTTAFETLRNPSKRREYDRSLEPKREPVPERLEWSFRAAQQTWTPFIASMRTDAPSAPASHSEPYVVAEPDPEPEPQPQPAPESNPVPESKVEAIAASLRELAKSAAPEDASNRIARSQAERPRSEATLDQLVDQIRTSGRADRVRLRDNPARSLDWKQPIWAAGGLVLGVGILGGIAGITAGGDAQESVTVAVPAATPLSKTAEASTQLASSLVQIPEQRERSEVAPGRAEPSRPLARPAVLEDEPVQVATQDSTSDTQADTVASDPLAPIAAAAPSAAANLPLSNAVIARTIDRIGYPCGEVASAAPADGDGVFKITCSSGHTYQAAPVHGRYRFRRWDRR